MRSFTQSPAARLDYGVDWTAFLGTDSIASASWLEPTGTLTLDDFAVSDGVHSVFVAGGESGRAYRLTSRVETAAGRAAEETIVIFVRGT